MGTRRNFLRQGAGIGLGALGLSAAPTLAEQTDSSTLFLKRPKAKKIIYLFVDGGLSQIDSFDPKPKMRDVMMDTKVIDTKIDGVQYGHYFPQLAANLEKYCLVRTMSTGTASHGTGVYVTHRNYRPGTANHPPIGAWVSKMLPTLNENLPKTVAIHERSQGLGSSGGFFGAKHAATTIPVAANGLPAGRQLSDVSDERAAGRLKALKTLNEEFYRINQSNFVKDHLDVLDNTLSLLRSPDFSAFDLSKETDQTLARYGDSKLGRGLLLARRLIENDVRFVEVTTSGWDHHDNVMDEMSKMGPMLDRALAALINDLDASGLLEETLVVVTTEFGRQNHVSGKAGRDHGPGGYCQILAGGGTKKGFVYGKTMEDAQGVRDKKDKVSPEDFFVTMAYALGLDYNKKYLSLDKREFAMNNEGKGKPVTALFQTT
ncbi:MAG: hypothetical protein CMI30_00775 [Opitutae bacterium]|nr:hypothetical protein [Opitutae bacterium]